ncbi:MAG: sugar ABC transporter permease [Clostridia bacterium]|nr:sugar ABC transporter permease [Clostridia bacterium]
MDLRTKAPAAIQIKRKSLAKRIYEFRYLYLLLSFTLIYFIIFKYAPMYGVQLAFKKFTYRRGITGSEWIGWKNFQDLFRSQQFTRTIGNTVAISLGRLFFTFFIPIIVAVLLNEIRCSAFKRVVQTFMYLPHFLSWVIISGIAYSLLSVNGGFINKLLLAAGGQSVNFLLEPECFRPILYISSVWKEVGWESIIYLAALAGINPELYEAATVDGANRFKQMIHVTWPGIRSTVVIMLILTVSRIMSAGFDQIYNLYSSPVFAVADIIDTYTYRELFLKSKFGQATAAGLFQAVINIVMVVVTNQIAKMINDGEGLY